jgi:chemotaxis protein CheC
MPLPSEAPAVEVADALRTVAVNSAYNASRALSKWFKRGVRLTCDGFEAMPIQKVATLAGPPDTPVAAVHMTLTGDITGDILLVFPEPVAMHLCDLMIGVSPGTTTCIGEIEASCLQETGNIVGSAFTNCLASWLKLGVIPASPTVVHDLACAVIQPILVNHAAMADEALICKTEFDLDGQRMEWFLLLLPSTDSLKTITTQCAGDEVRKNAMHTIAINGAFAASRAMSKWLRRGVRLSTEGFVRTPLRSVCSQTETDEPVVALHMQLISQLHGHALLVLPMKSALELVGILTGAAPGTTVELDEMALSCLQETGNIISSSFVNSWSKWLEIHSEPQPPQLKIDLLPAILESILVEQAMVSDEVFMAKTSFGVNGRWLDWDFYLMPTPATLRLIETSIS